MLKPQGGSRKSERGKSISMKDTTEDLLDEAIWACIIMPKGDPNPSNLYPAACIAKALMDEGLEVGEEALKTLKGDNVCGRNFIEEVERNNEI